MPWKHWRNATEQNKISSQRTQERSGLNQDAAPFIPKETTTPVKCEVATPTYPFIQQPLEPPLDPPLIPVRLEAEARVPLNPFTPSSFELPPVPVERRSLSSTNPSPSEVALQEIVRLQAKQTELSALIAEQQRISSLPTQEPPTFNGNYFDYPIFMRAFETIVEAVVFS